MSCEFRDALSCARPAVSRGRRSGFTLVELLVVISIIGMLMALLLPQLSAVRETGRQNTCRNNMRAIATALFNYNVRNSSYPGYMNVLIKENGQPFVDPTGTTSSPTPVSWAVMILTDIDRGPLFDLWRRSGAGGTASGSGASYATRFYTDQYIELLICPSDPPPSRSGTPISYVTNSGQQDLAPNASQLSKTIPRDWAASGVFFDNFTQHSLVNTTTARNMNIVMSDDKIRDPKDKTILLTENVDATDYVFLNDGSSVTGTYWFNTELEAGCNWSTGTIDTGTSPPTLAPLYSAGSGGGGGGGGGSGGGSGSSTTGTNDTLRINNSAGKSDGSYAYCRPSSKHPQMVNVAFAGQNVQQLRDSISYFIFAKLMASEDESLKIVGQNTLMDQALRTYPLSESDLAP